MQKLEVWSLKAKDCLFQPLQDKETPACAYNSSWSELLLFSLSLSVFFFLTLFSITCSVVLSSFVLYDIALYYDVSFMWLKLICMYDPSQTNSALVTKCLQHLQHSSNQAIWNKAFCLSGTHGNRKTTHKFKWFRMGHQDSEIHGQQMALLISWDLTNWRPQGDCSWQQPL